MATAGHLWFDCWNVLLQGGWTLFNQMPLLFCVALPISLANKQNARCCMEALAIYLTFNYFVSTILGQWGPVFGVDYSVEAGNGTGLATIASIKTLDMGIMGALIISGIATMLHNKYFDTELPGVAGRVLGLRVHLYDRFLRYGSGRSYRLPGMAACSGCYRCLPGIHPFRRYVWRGRLCFLRARADSYRPAPLYLYAVLLRQRGGQRRHLCCLGQHPAPTGCRSRGIALKDVAPWAAYTCPGWTKVFGSLGVAIAFLYDRQTRAQAARQGSAHSRHPYRYALRYYRAA